MQDHNGYVITEGGRVLVQTVDAADGSQYSFNLWEPPYGPWEGIITTQDILAIVASWEAIADNDPRIPFTGYAREYADRAIREARRYVAQTGAA